MAYILRLSHANHYTSPWRVLSVAGYAQDEMFRPTLNPKRLAERLGPNGDRLRLKALVREEGDGRRTYLIGSEPIGRSLTHSPYRLERPAICPQCVVQDRFGRQSWDLAAVSACPRHGRKLLQVCGACSKPLTWYRRSLLRCACGANLARQVPDEASAAEIELAAMLERRIDGDAVTDQPSAAGLPLEALSAVPFDGLIKLIQTLHRLRPKDWLDQGSPGLTAARVFGGWPRGFHRYLRDMGAMSGEPPTSVALRRRFESLYGALFKRKLMSKHLAFMREAFVDFGLQEWGEVVVDAKMRGTAGRNRRFVSATAFAQKAGVQPITVRRWVEKGRLGGSLTKGRSVRGFVIDTAGVDDQDRPRAERLQAREAGKLIGLPVTVLRQLKASGHYSVNPAVNAARGFWKADLDSLGKRIVDCATAEGRNTTAAKLSEPDCVLLGDVLSKMKFGDEGAKGRLLAGLLDGKTRAVGEAPNRLHQLRLSVADVEIFRVGDSVNRPSAAVSRQAAAAMLNVGLYAIPALLEAGLLREPQGKAAGIDRESVLQFQQNWRLVSKLAQELRTNSSRLIAEARRRKMEFRELPVKPGYELVVMSRAVAGRLASASSVET